MSNFSDRLRSLFGQQPSGPLSLERKVEILKSCGLSLEPPFTMEDLLTSWSSEEFEKPGFELLLAGLGMTEEQPPWRNHCRNLWHFDTECIEDHGAYIRLAERMKEMAQGSLPIENLRDFVDIAKGEAWLAFEYRGEEIRLDCAVNDDWVDPALFKHFVRMLAESDPNKLLVHHSTGGQDGFIACVTKSQHMDLQKQGIAFDPLR